MNRKQLIQEYLKFFESKNHKIIPNASLIPKDDPTVLFTTAGMHPLTPYLLGQKHPLGKRLVNVQKCIRTTDIEEVGDASHHTFIEMLGNWSLGDYWKKQAIEYSFEFLTKVLRIPKEKISITCFSGDKNAPKDTESAEIWKSLGINKIKFLGKKDNWWGPAGKTGPCGPNTEMFVNRFEIWNDVFMKYNKRFRDILLVDAIHCLIDKEKGVNKRLADFLTRLRDSSAVRIIVVTNAPKEKIKNKLKKEGYNFEVFTLNKNPEKTDPAYFKKLIERHKWENYKERIIYFDHKKENIKSAEKSGIVFTKHYKNDSEVIKWVNKTLPIYLPLKQKNIDTGMGVERTLAILNNLDDDYMTETFLPIIKKIEEMSGKDYGKDEEVTKSMRIIADHIKAAVFVMNEGILPTHKERGYVLRRLIRRAIVHGEKLGLLDFTTNVAKIVFDIYPDYFFKEDKRIWFVNRDTQTFILDEIEREEMAFKYTLDKGLKIFKDLVRYKKKISGEDAFLLFQSHGFPIELTQELAKERKIKVDIKGFEKELAKHQKLSRTASSGSFKSGLADQSEKTIKLHTATHLLNEALRKVLDKNIKQRGSNITPERLRFDFNFPRKLTEKEIKKVEDLVNKKISQGLKITSEEMPLKKALKIGIRSEFNAKYPDMVSVYSIGNFSKEICTGPHVKNTNEIGKFKIIKEESSAAGIRRIKAVVN